MTNGAALTLLALCVAVSVGAALLTGALRQYALRGGFVDVPNARSSHERPTPRGGGLAIVATFLAALVAVDAIFSLPGELLLAFLGGGMAVGLVGAADDYGHVRTRWRLAAHVAASWWAASLLGGGVSAIGLFGVDPGLRWVGEAVAVVGVVWLLNLYNFMDGIDGIAGIEAVTVGVGLAALHSVGPGGTLPPILPLALASGAAGFLVWNFPRARIFMGDAGSGFLGFVFGVFVLQAASHSSALFWSTLILLGAFITDATVTLVRRLLRSEKVYLPHRTHAYQHLARRIGKHWPVSIIFGLVNMVWLLPLALLVVLGRLDGVVGLMVAYGPLVWLAIRCGAGESEIARG